MDNDDEGGPPRLPRGKIYMTPGGKTALQAEYESMKAERHRVVEIVSWAAGNGDRSENAEYQYGKRRLREIDRRVRFLRQRLERVQVVDPARQPRRDQVYFGATVTYARAARSPDAAGGRRESGGHDPARDTEVTVTIVGVDEADMAAGKISIGSPMALAMLRARVGDEVTVRTPAGPRSVEITRILYPDPPPA